MDVDEEREHGEEQGEQRVAGIEGGRGEKARAKSDEGDEEDDYMDEDDIGGAASQGPTEPTVQPGAVTLAVTPMGNEVAQSATAVNKRKNPGSSHEECADRSKQPRHHAATRPNMSAAAECPIF